jgi:WXG100 family type VII secretion target
MDEQSDRSDEAGWSVGRGWWPTVARLERRLRESVPGFEGFAEVKTKFGGLRAYPDFADDTPGEARRRAYLLVEAAAERCAAVCEKCGLPGRLREDRAWILTLCDECDHAVPDSGGSRPEAPDAALWRAAVAGLDGAMTKCRCSNGRGFLESSHSVRLFRPDGDGYRHAVLVLGVAVFRHARESTCGIRPLPFRWSERTLVDLFAEVEYPAVLRVSRAMSPCGLAARNPISRRCEMSKGDLSVDVDAVIDASIRVSNTADELSGKLDSLDGVAGGLLGSGWTGEAGSSYREAYDLFHQGAKEVHEGLGKMHEALADAAREYAAQEHANQKSLTLDLTYTHEGGSAGAPRFNL